MAERPEPGQVLFLNLFNGNFNAGIIGQSQEKRVALAGAGSPPGRRSSASAGRLHPQVLESAAKAFVPPENFELAGRVLAKRRIVFLAHGRGTGRRTLGLNLLRRHVGAGVVRHLDESLDLGCWNPAADEADGFLLDGTLGALVQRPAALASLAADLRDAGKVLVVLLPEDDELAVRVEEDTEFSPIRCVPPPGADVLLEHLAVAVPDECRRRRILDGFSWDFLEGLLPVGAAPGAALEALDALRTAARLARTPAERPAFVLAELTVAAQREIGERLAAPLDDAQRSCLIAAAVFAGKEQHVVMEQAARLHAQIRRIGRSASDGGTDTEVAFSTLLAPFGIRTDLVWRPGRPARSIVVFMRPLWTLAIMRHAWHRMGIGRALVRWLGGVGAENHLVERAGWALAQSVSPKPGVGGLRDVRACVTSGGPSGYVVAAAALRTLLEDPGADRETLGLLCTWAYAERVAYRITAATACGGRTETASLRPALTVLRYLVKGAEENPHGRVDRAVDDAMLDLFLRDDGIEVLRELVAWSETEDAEAQYAVRIVPRFLHVNPLWFESQMDDPEAARLITTLITRSIRARNCGRLRETVVRWRRSAQRDPSRAASVETLLVAVGEDPHPRVRRFLDAINRHD
ncbi:hypothetical protein [Actinomadura rugatobispora]|uniref:Uncharacterized protein n=1 Tax=Actinomadura rugatobispora TaxID=1994 RepID=A0ABW1AFN8_9ACTN|nr:hypothetical protein GCM10010200_021780 [Actinomadura rugatobispora]